MTYERLKASWPGKRKWYRWCSGFYLQRFRGAIRVRYGYRFRHSQIIAVWYPDGRFKFVGQQYYPSQRIGLRHFMPDGYQIWSHRYYSFIQQPNQDKKEAKCFWLRTHHPEQKQDSADAKFNKRNKWVKIGKTGVTNKLGQMLKTISSRLAAEDYIRDKPRRRGRYWLRKARGVYRDRRGKNYYQGCEWLRKWPRPAAEWTGGCGCHVFTKRAVSHDTVASILAEANATVRTAKIQIYGIEKFFTDAKARTIDKEAGYELLTLDTGRAHRESRGRWEREQTANVVLTALRMECSTTGKVYVNTVPPEIRTVRQGLDWMFDIIDYLGRVGKQT